MVACFSSAVLLFMILMLWLHMSACACIFAPPAVSMGPEGVFTFGSLVPSEREALRLISLGKHPNSYLKASLVRRRSKGYGVARAQAKPLKIGVEDMGLALK